MSPWFKFPVSFFGDARTLKLGKAVGAETARWIIPALWAFAVQQEAADGDLSAYDAQDLADALRYKGDAVAMLAAFKDAGWLDAEGRVTGWTYLYSLAAGRQSAAQKGAAGRWKNHTKHSEEEEKKERRERGESHALRDAMRDASTPTLPALALSEPQKLAISKKLKITVAGVEDALGVFLGIKANFPQDVITADSFSGWLRCSKEGKAVRAEYAVAKPTASQPEAVSLPEPADWREKVRADPERAAEFGIEWAHASAWETMNPHYQKQIVKFCGGG